MAQQKLDPVTMKDVRIIFKNFEGKEGPYNKRGTKTFGVILPPEYAEAMAADGWPVKHLRVREEDLQEDPDAQPVAWLPVEAAYDKGRPPKIVLVTSRGRTTLDEETVQEIDNSDIVKVDLIVNPYFWDVNGKSGIKAYVKTMFVTIEEDELEAEYAEMDSQ